MTLLSDLLDDAVGHVEPLFDGRDIRARVQRRRRHALVRRSIGIIVVLTLAVPAVLFLARDRSQLRDVRVQPSGGPPGASDVVAFDDNGGVSVADFATRIATHYPLGGWRPGDQPFLSLRVGDYIVAGWGDVYATPLSGGKAQLLGTGVFVPAVEPGAVWLTSYGQVQTSTERLVDMHGHVILQGRVPRDAAGHEYVAITGVPNGVVVQTPNGLAVWDARTGRITRRLGTTSAITALPMSGSLLAWCDRCDRALEITDLTTGITRSIAVSLNGGSLSMERYIAFSPDGTQLAVLAPPDAAAPLGATTRIVVVDVIAGKVAELVDTHARYAAVAWSPDGKRLYIAASVGGSGGRVLVHDRATHTTQDIGPVPDLSGTFSTVMTRDDAARLPIARGSCTSAPTSSTTNGNNQPCRYKF